MTRLPPRTGRGQRGTVMVLVITILAALLAGASVALYLQVTSTRAAGLSSHMRGALYCAEAGLAAARNTIANDPDVWPSLLDGDDATNPAWYPIQGDIDEPPDGVPDYVVTVRDNDDEFPPNDLDPTTDSDERIIIVSTCTKYSDAPREVLEIISLQATPGHDYADQSGYGGANAGNRNVAP